MLRNIKKKIKAIEYLGNKCNECGQTFEHFIYDFHHKVPSEKEFVWGKLRNFSWERIKKELDKCELLCCICHRRKEYSKYTYDV